jgi:hypothetical protein
MHTIRPRNESHGFVRDGTYLVLEGGRDVGGREFDFEGKVYKADMVKRYSKVVR